MGGVELLSKESEIAIAKRIEAGKDVMINALTQSPIVGKKIFEWKEQIESQQMLVRDIIDITHLEDFEALDDDDDLKINKKTKSKKEKEKIDDTEKKRKTPQAKMMNSMFLWQKWKRRSNQNYKYFRLSLIKTIQNFKNIKLKNLNVY